MTKALTSSVCIAWRAQVSCSIVHSASEMPTPDHDAAAAAAAMPAQAPPAAPEEITLRLGQAPPAPVVQFASQSPVAVVAPSPVALSASACTLSASGDLSDLRRLRSAWLDMPDSDLTITFEKLRLDLTVPPSSTHLPNLWSSYRDKLCALNPCKARATTTAAATTGGCAGAAGPQPPLRLLHACTGMIRPGELTLVLSPPGHGKSVLLKTLAGRMQRDFSSGGMSGELRWNGLTASELSASGLHLEKLCAYVDQGDVHYPILTVRETFAFAVANSNADTRSLGVPELDHLQAQNVEHMLQMLGLTECADTIVGNALIRGVRSVIEQALRVNGQEAAATIRT